MLRVLVIGGGVTAIFTVAALFCANGGDVGPNFLRGAVDSVRKTFVPMTKQEFWFPPCPICWLVRAAVVLTAICATAAVYA